MSSLDPCFSREFRSMSLLLEQTTNSLLVFALYDDVEIRATVAKELWAALSLPLITIFLSPENSNPSEEVERLGDTIPRSCFLFFNAEEAFPKFLGFVNLQRERLLRTRHALVFWLREEGMRRVANSAPDFWAWRSQVFDFRAPATCKVGASPPDPHDQTTAVFNRSDIASQVSVLRDTPSGSGTDSIGIQSSLARRLLSLGQVQEAEKALRNALQSAVEIGDRASQAEAMQLLGNLLLERGETLEAENLTKDALALSGSSPNLRAILYRQLSAIELLQNKVAIAARHAGVSVELSRAAGDFISLAGSLHQLGNVLAQEGRWREAETAYLDAIEHEKKLGMVRDLGLTRYRLGRVYEQMGALQNAEQQLLQAIEAFRKEEMMEYQGRTWEALAGVYEARKDLDRANEAHARADSLALSSPRAPEKEIGAGPV